MGKILIGACLSAACMMIIGSAVDAHELLSAREPAAADFTFRPAAGAAQTLTVIFGEPDPLEHLGEPDFAAGRTSGATIFTELAAAPLLETDAPAVPAQADQAAPLPATAVPEPAALVLVGLGLLGLIGVLRRRSKQHGVR